MSPLSALGGAVSLNLLLRTFSFALTIIVTRVASPEFRGAAFQLEMLSETVSFLAKDAIRSLYAAYGKSLATTKPHGHSNDGCMGLLYLSLATLPMGAAVVVLMELLAFLSPITPISGVAALSGPGGVWLPGGLFLAGIVLEFAAEPLLAASAAAQELQSRVWAESLAVVGSKAVVAVLLSYIGLTEDGLTATVCLLAATQQFVYGLTFLLVFVVRSWRSKDPVMSKLTHSWRAAPLSAAPAGVVSEFQRQRTAWWPLFTETGVRLVLTQFQKYILAAYASLSDQGVFDTVNSLGVLVVRTVFRVLEVGAYNVWAAQMGFEKRVEDVRAGVPMLGSLLRVCGYVGLLCVSMATTDVLRYALFLLFSSRWATDEAVELLQWMCWYIPLLGANGQLEAFVRASSSPSVFAQVRNSMMVVSVLSIGLSVYLVKGVEWGSVGLMIASVISVGARILVSLWLMAATLSWDTLVVRNHSLMLMGTLSALTIGLVRAGLVYVGDIPSQISVAVLTQVGCCAVLGIAPLLVVVFIVESHSSRPLLPARLLLPQRLKVYA